MISSCRMSSLVHGSGPIFHMVFHCSPSVQVEGMEPVVAIHRTAPLPDLPGYLTCLFKREFPKRENESSDKHTQK